MSAMNDVITDPHMALMDTLGDLIPEAHFHVVTFPGAVKSVEKYATKREADYRANELTIAFPLCEHHVRKCWGACKR